MVFRLYCDSCSPFTSIKYSKLGLVHTVFVWATILLAVSTINEALSSQLCYGIYYTWNKHPLNQTNLTTGPFLLKISTENFGPGDNFQEQNSSDRTLPSYSLFIAVHHHIRQKTRRKSSLVPRPFFATQEKFSPVEKNGLGTRLDHENVNLLQVHFL